MKRDRVAEIHFYEWRIGAWSISETRDRLNAAGRGIYRELLDHCYGQGKIPDDPEWMCRRCACTPEELQKALKVIGRHFPKIDGTEYRSNVFADMFRTDYFSFIEKQREASRSRDKKPKKIKDIRIDGSSMDHPCKKMFPSDTIRYDTKQDKTDTKQDKTTPIESELGSAIERMYARHPKKKDLVLVPDSLEKAVSVNPLEEIEAVHSAWCTTPEWKESNGRFVPSLAKWLSDRGYLQWPEGMAPETPKPKRKVKIIPYDPYGTGDGKPIEMEVEDRS